VTNLILLFFLEVVATIYYIIDKKATISLANSGQLCVIVSNTDFNCFLVAAAQFMFDRTRQHQMSAFFNEENDSNVRSSKQDVSVGDREKQKQHDLRELDEVRLRSCLEEIRSVIGDSIPEQILIDSVLKNEFNFSRALDDILNSAASATGQPAASECALHY
jgi:elongation factor 1 alpha-like protein